MIRQLIVSILVIFICLSIYPKGVESKNFKSIYPTNYDDCEFPFTYRGKSYNNCTTDGDNGDTLWCSLTGNYVGMFTYCYDFFNSSIDCLATYTVNGKQYSGCSVLAKGASYKQCKTSNPSYPLIYCPDAKKDAKKEFKKRRRECKKKYKDASPDHTKCFSPSPFAIQVKITEEEQRELLLMHNQYRAEVQADSMLKLYWDNDLADMAQARGDMCVFDHDMADNRVIPEFGWKNGQNMVMSNEIRNSLASLIDLMLGTEKELFIYGQGCNNSVPGTCLHYTQAMISSLTRVGCAHTHCVYKTHIERFLTCNFIQSQYASKYATPYTFGGGAGSKCPNTASPDDQLCDCGKKICNYGIGENLDPNTCECTPPKAKRSLDKRDTETVIAAPSVDAKSMLSKRHVLNLSKGKKHHHMSKREDETVIAAPSVDAKSMLSKRHVLDLSKGKKHHHMSKREDETVIAAPSVDAKSMLSKRHTYLKGKPKH